MTIPRNLSNLAPGASTTGVLDTAHGGTGTSTTFTAGSVVFAGGSGIYGQDNAQFFWDDTNNRLGLGTATPSEQLTITASAPTMSMNTPVDGNRVEQRFTNEGTLIWTVGLNYSGSDGIYFVQRNFGGGALSLLPDAVGALAIGGTTVTNNYIVEITGKTRGTSFDSTSGLYENAATIATDYTIRTGNNAFSAGPVVVNSGVVVTVPSGSTWVVA